MYNPAPLTRSITSRRSPARLLLGAGILSLAVSLSGCGSHDAAEARPSVKQITDSLTSGPLAQEMGLDSTGTSQSTFTCIAQKLEDSDLSDAALEAMVKADKSFEPSDADQKALGDLPSEMAACAAQ